MKAYFRILLIIVSMLLAIATFADGSDSYGNSFDVDTYRQNDNPFDRETYRQNDNPYDRDTYRQNDNPFDRETYRQGPFDYDD
jgi:hypothetical protein